MRAQAVSLVGTVSIAACLLACGESTATDTDDASTTEASNGGETSAGSADGTDTSTGGASTTGEPAFTIGGRAPDVRGQGLVLTVNGGDDLVVVEQGDFTFDTTFLQGQAFEVEIKAPPGDPDQSCTVENGVGAIDGASVSNILVTCENSPVPGLDPGFGSDGIRLLDDLFEPGAGDVPRGLGIAPDGALFVVGQTETPAGWEDGFVVKLDESGAFDTSFGDEGMRSHDSIQIELFKDVVFPPGGGILAVGAARFMGAPLRLLAVRYDDVGDLVPSFGQGGELMLDNLQGGCTPGASTETCFAAAVDVMGRVLISGHVTETDCTELDSLVLRLDPDTGMLDPTFAAGGVAAFQLTGDPTTDMRNESGFGLRLADPSGLLIAGTSWIPGGGSPAVPVVWRVTDAGELDPGFGMGGAIAFDDLGDDQSAHAVDVAIDGSGRILATGLSASGEDDSRMRIWRFAADGTLDGMFADTGVFTDDGLMFSSATRMQIDPQGRIVVLGYRNNLADDADVGLWRLWPDGSPDDTFGDDGLIVYDSGVGRDLGWDLELDSSGRAVATASVVTEDGDLAAAVLRVLQ